MNMRQEFQTAAVTVEGDRIRFIGGYQFGIDHIHAYQEESRLLKTYWHPVDAVQLIPPTVITAPTQPLHDALRAFNAAFETNYSF
jgi:hypothetical protein